MRLALLTAAWVLATLGAGTAQTAPAPSPEEVRVALERAGAYFRDELGVAGTFAWTYSRDGRTRRGEGGEIPASLGWVQPPGTPAVGAAFLRIFEVTADPQWLDAAHDVATALVETQLLSGGWAYGIETDPEKARGWCYRASGITGKECRRIEGNPDRNRSMLDDNRTQSVVNFLMWFDKADGGADEDVGIAIDEALDRLMAVQYRNGAFPAVFAEEAPGANEEIAAAARIPESWPTQWEKPEGPPFLVVNDNVPRDTGRMFLNAYRLYGRPAYLKTAMEIGDFLVAAQLPRPQQGWAQLYDRSFQPIWGRKFEPPAVVSSETAGCIDYLLELHEATSKARYLDVAGSAGEWLEAARLPDGSWARFYELSSNRPIYVDNSERITFQADDLLDHYGMKGDFGIEPVLARLVDVRLGRRLSSKGFWVDPAAGLGVEELEARVRELVDTQQDGRWIDGEWIEGRRFVDGVFTLARFLELSPSN